MIQILVPDLVASIHCREGCPIEASTSHFGVFLRRLRGPRPQRKLEISQWPQAPRVCIEYDKYRNATGGDHLDRSTLRLPKPGTRTPQRPNISTGAGPIRTRKLSDQTSYDSYGKDSCSGRSTRRDRRARAMAFHHARLPRNTHRTLPPEFFRAYLEKLRQQRCVLDLHENTD